MLHSSVGCKVLDYESLQKTPMPLFCEFTGQCIGLTSILVGSCHTNQHTALVGIRKSNTGYVFKQKAIFWHANKRRDSIRSTGQGKRPCMVARTQMPSTVLQSVASLLSND